MSINRVKDYLSQWGATDRVQEFKVSSATVELAAIALDCAPARIAKTLSFWVKERVILIVTAGDAKIDNAKYKTHFGVKAKMLTYDEVSEKVGFAVGGVCPFAVNEGVVIYLDKSLQRFATVFPACGTSNSAIEVTIGELEEYSKCNGWIDVCKLDN